MALSLDNFILRTDSYKLTHWLALPKNLKYVKSYMEARGGAFPKTVWDGLQYYVKAYLDGVRITVEDVNEAEAFAEVHFGKKGIFNREGWMYIVEHCDGRLPIKILAVEEGTVVPVSNVLMIIENTDEHCPWLTNVVETLLMKIWYPTTIATNSFYQKVDIATGLLKSGGDINNVIWKLHDFGYRGVSCEEQAGIGGMAHLTQFMGTDTIRGIQFADNYYNSGICGFSVAASEHFVACCYGKEGELDYIETMLDSYDGLTTSAVSDTYNVFNLIRTASTKFKDKILARTNPFVFRPDSGHPVKVNCGHGWEDNGKYYGFTRDNDEFCKEITRDEYLGLIGILWEIFGEYGTIVNGFKLLPPQVRIIQGDGIDREMAIEILRGFIDKGFSTDNVVFGSGGGLLQKVNRDTCEFAIKASYAILGDRRTTENDVYVDLVKEPITSKGKRSKPGDLKLILKDGILTTISSKNVSKEEFESYTSLLTPVYYNGFMVKETTLQTIKDICEPYFQEEVAKRMLEEEL